MPLDIKEAKGQGSRNLRNRPESVKHRLAKQAEDLGIVHFGRGVYGKEGTHIGTHKLNDTGTELIPIPPDEIPDTDSTSDQDDKDKNTEKDLSPTTTSPKKPTPHPVSRTQPTRPTSPLGGTTNSPKTPRANSEYDIHKFFQEVTSKLQSVLKKIPSAVGNEFKPVANEFYETLTNIVQLTDKRDVKKFSLDEFTKKYNIMFNGRSYVASLSLPGGGPSISILPFGDKLTGMAKFFEKISRINSVSVPRISQAESNPLVFLSTNSSINLGREFRESDSLVSHIFSNKIFRGLEQKPLHKKLFGPTDHQTNGLLRSGGKNSKKFFQHSIEHGPARSIVNALQKISEESSDKFPTVSSDATKMMGSLKLYRANMEMILDSWDDISTEERVQSVSEVYGRLVADLHETNDKMASAIMKNVAELALYDMELADELEVYLPATKNFPTADKIVVSTDEDTHVETISTISVKYGINKSNIIGMPGEVESLMGYHPSETRPEKWHKMVSSSPGKAGYETGVSGEIINDALAFNQIWKLSGFNDIFDNDPDAQDQIRQLGVDLTAITKQFKLDLPLRDKSRMQIDPITGDAGVREIRDASVMKEMEEYKPAQKAWGKLHDIARKHKKKLIEFLGEDNYSKLFNSRAGKNSPNSMALFSIMAFSAGLKTSKGFPAVKHNHQAYVNGTFHSSTIDGTEHIKDWTLEWRPYGSSASGLRAGFNPSRLQGGNIFNPGDE